MGDVRRSGGIVLRDSLAMTSLLATLDSAPAIDSPLDAPLPDQVEPPIRVMALHALLYCERLFYLEEVEELRVADHAVYAGRRCG